MKVFIDHFPAVDDFVLRLAKQIKRINKEIEVITFIDIRESGARPEDKEEIRIMNESDILIPIITSEFLSHYPETSEQEYFDLSEDDNKIIFPVIYDEANWSSKNWIVKSKVFPSNNKIYVDLNSNEQSLVVNELVRTIGNVQTEIGKSKEKPAIDNKKGRINKTDKQVFISHSHSDACSLTLFVALPFLGHR